MHPGRSSNRSSATANVTLYCTWRPSGLTIGLHGQGPFLRKESPIATKILVYTIKFLCPSCQNLEANPNLGKCHIGNLNPYTENFTKKSPPIFEKGNICKIPLFYSNRNYPLANKLQSMGLNISLMCFKFQSNTLIPQGFIEVRNFRFH